MQKERDRRLEKKVFAQLGNQCTYKVIDMQAFKKK